MKDSVQKIFTQNPIFFYLWAIPPLIGMTLRFDLSILLSLEILFISLFVTLIYGFSCEAIPEKGRKYFYIGILTLGGTIFLAVLLFLAPNYYKEAHLYMKLLLVSSLIFYLYDNFSPEKDLGKYLINTQRMILGYILVAITLAFVREILGFGTLTFFKIRENSIQLVIPYFSDYSFGWIAYPAGFLVLFGYILSIIKRSVQQESEKKKGISLDSLRDSGGGLKQSSSNETSRILPQHWVKGIKSSYTDKIPQIYLYLGEREVPLYKSVMWQEESTLSNLRWKAALPENISIEKRRRGVFKQKAFSGLPKKWSQKYLVSGKEGEKAYVRPAAVLRGKIQHITIKDVVSSGKAFPLVVVEMAWKNLQSYLSLSELSSLVDDNGYIIFEESVNLYSHGFEKIEKGLWKKTPNKEKDNSIK